MDNEKNIRLFRGKMKQDGVTFAKLQEMTAIPDTTLNNYFLGKVRNPKISNVLRIAEALGVPQESLHLDIPENPTVPDKPNNCPCDRVRTLELLLSKEEGKGEHAEKRIADVKEQAERRVAEVTAQAHKRIEQAETATSKRVRDHKMFIALLLALLIAAIIFAAYEVLMVDRYTNDRGLITFDTPAPTATPSSETHANLPGEFGKWFLENKWSESEIYAWSAVFNAVMDEKDRSLDPYLKIKNPVHVAIVTGSVYHTDENCNALKNAHTVVTMDEAEAIERGFKECGRCE